MKDGIKELIARRKKIIEQDLEHAKALAKEMLAKATKEGEKLISYQEGKLNAFENIEELDWDYYAKNHLGIKNG